MDRARQHEIVLVPQGGGALGSYKAGVFEALAESRCDMERALRRASDAA